MTAAPSAPPQLALKVDVDTLRGTLEGVPPLVDVLQKHSVQTTFLFSLRPDNTGDAATASRSWAGRSSPDADCRTDRKNLHGLFVKIALLSVFQAPGSRNVRTMLSPAIGFSIARYRHGQE